MSQKTSSKHIKKQKFSAENLPFILMILCLLALVIGWVSEHNGQHLLASGSWVIAYATGGYFGLRGGIRALQQRIIDVDLLMILAAIGAAIVGEPFEGALLLFLFSLSNVLQAYAMDRTRSAIAKLVELRPDEAQVQRNGQWTILPISEIVQGEILAIKGGERIALDGIVVHGAGAVDQSTVTGESIPIEKQIGDRLLAGTLQTTGYIEMEVTHSAESSTLTRLIELVSQAQDEKAVTQRFLDEAEQRYATAVIIITILAIFVPQLAQWESFTDSFYRAMTLLVAASPCALIISTPATILSAIANGAKHGVLFKGGSYVEQAAEIQVMAFDKTGTLTVGKPAVTDLYAVQPDRLSSAEFLRLAAGIEAKSDHPLAHAIVEEAVLQQIAIPQATQFNSELGVGVLGTVENRSILISKPSALPLDPSLLQQVEAWQLQGKTTVIVSEKSETGWQPVGIIGIADQIRPDAEKMLQTLQSIGIQHRIMLTGDNENVARAIGNSLPLTEIYAGLMPGEKQEIIRELQQKYGKVAMIGDGINDSPALASADIGFAMGGTGSDVAMETADIILMADKLERIPYAIRLSKLARKRLIANLGIAFGAIIIMIFAIFTNRLSLPMAVIGHEGGTVLVCLNGLRLLFTKPSS